MHGAHMVYRKWGYAWCTESGGMHGVQKVGACMVYRKWGIQERQCAQVIGHFRCDLKESHYACSTVGTWGVV